MEKKRAKEFIYEGLGFPIIMIDVSLIKVRDVWTPAIDYNKLQRTVIEALSHKPYPLSGNEVHFIRTYFEMTLDAFGKHFGVTHVAVLNWEKTKNKLAKMNPAVELFIRLFILEKLKTSNQIFRNTFRELIQHRTKIRKAAFGHKPLRLHDLQVVKRTAFHAT